LEALSPGHDPVATHVRRKLTADGLPLSMFSGSIARRFGAFTQETPPGVEAGVDVLERQRGAEEPEVGGDVAPGRGR